MPPFTEDTAPLVIVLDLSTSMNAVDVQPTRLERAKQKLRDLLAFRSGARTALIAYAGSAHTVLPLCDDASIFETFLVGLESDVMPLAGKDPAAALELASELLAGESVPGSIVFLTDGIAEEYAGVFAEHTGGSDNEVLVLAFGTEEGGAIRSGEDGFETDASGRRMIATLDSAGLEALESGAGISVTGGERRRSRRRAHRSPDSESSAGGTAPERNGSLEGSWLLADFSDRCSRSAVVPQGMERSMVRLSSAFLIAALAGGGSWWLDLWLSPDQQGRRLFERGDSSAAAEHFEDPMWKGIAHFRAGEHDLAIDAFSRVPTAEGAYNLGNSLAALERWEPALAAYDAALAERSGWREAEENRAAVAAEIEQRLEFPEDEQASGEPSFDPDEIAFDEKGKKGTTGEIEVSQLTDDQLAEMWLRRLQSSPADYLKQRFAIEVAMAEGEGR